MDKDYAEVSDAIQRLRKGETLTEIFESLGTSPTRDLAGIKSRSEEEVSSVSSFTQFMDYEGEYSELTREFINGLEEGNEEPDKLLTWVFFMFRDQGWTLGDALEYVYRWYFFGAYWYGREKKLGNVPAIMAVSLATFGAISHWDVELSFSGFNYYDPEDKAEWLETILSKIKDWRTEAWRMWWNRSKFSYETPEDDARDFIHNGNSYHDSLEHIMHHFPGMTAKDHIGVLVLFLGDL